MLERSARKLADLRPGVGAVVLLLAAVGGCTRVAPPEPAGPSGSVATTTTPARAAVLAPPSYRIAPMPISPTWQPPGTDVRPALLYTGYFLRYPVAALELLVSYEDPTDREVGPRGERTPATMLGVVAGEYVVPFGHAEYTVWSLTDPDGLWVVVSGTDPGMVRQFAQGLRREPIELSPPFEVALLPEGFVPIRVDAYTMDFSDTNVVGGGEFISIGISVRDPNAGRRPGTPATVNGHPAEVIVWEEDSSIHVVVSLSESVDLNVFASGGLNLDESQVRRLAEGVTVTEYAVPWVNP